MKKELFPTLLFHERLVPVSSSLLKELRREAEFIQDDDARGRRWSTQHYPFGYTSYGSIDQLQHFSSQFETLCQRIDRTVRKAVRDLRWGIQPTQVRLSKMWLNVMATGAAHSGHIHPYSLLSGTFYVTTPKDSGAIRFEDPRLGFFMGRPCPRARAPARLKNFYSIQPQPGECVLFESWLRHEVLPTRRPREARVSISFNYDWVQGV